MTIQELKSELKKLNRSLKLLVNNEKIWYCGSFSVEIAQSRKTEDDWFLSDELCGVMKKIEEISAALDYLSRPIKGEYVLHKNSRGRYECEDHEYTSGDKIEYFCYDEYDDVFKWVKSRVEYNDEIGDYYIVRAPEGVVLEGLKIRRRE